MAQMELAGNTYEVDENGFMQETDKWTEDVARAYAELENVSELSEEHWQAINYLRNYYLENGKDKKKKEGQIMSYIYSCPFSSAIMPACNQCPSTT